jgi:hypothetical protein
MGTRVVVVLDVTARNAGDLLDLGLILARLASVVCAVDSSCHALMLTGLAPGSQVQCLVIASSLNVPSGFTSRASAPKVAASRLCDRDSAHRCWLCSVRLWIQV